MANRSCSCLVLALLALHVAPVQCLLVIGCPLYGCRPSGSFSFTLDVPRVNASIAWSSDFFCGPIPKALGCVGNDVSVVCQSNGPGPSDVGYVSIDSTTGAVQWRDGILKFPSLPIMTNYGDITGTDGSNLVHYDATGHLQPVIHLEGQLKPIFSLQLVGTEFILIVSETGLIAVRQTNGVPVASLFLNGTEQRSNGTFLPVSQPVVNGNRFYVLTEFVPESSDDVGILNLQRLYAIDVHDRLADRLTVAWYFNFERLAPPDSRLKFTPEKQKRQNGRREQFRATATNQYEARDPILLWHYFDETVYVSLPPPLGSEDLGVVSTFWGIKDNGDSPQKLFMSDLDVAHMLVFEPNTDDTETVPNAGAQLWVTLPDGKICAVRSDGQVIMEIDVSDVLMTTVSITSKLVTARARITDEDILIFGVKVSHSTPQFSKLLQSFGLRNNNATHFVVGIDTPLNSNDIRHSVAKGKLLFLLPTPDDTEVKGQIAAVPGTDKRMKDQLIFFSQVDGKFGKFFSVH